jgi:hypothetical protein
MGNDGEVADVFSIHEGKPAGRKEKFHTPTVMAFGSESLQLSLPSDAGKILRWETG